MRKYLLAGAILLVLIAAGIAYFMIEYQKNRKDAEYLAAYAQAHDWHHNADFDKSIPAFEQLATTAPSISKATQAKLKLAFDLFSRNQGDDRSRGIALYKQIITDPSVSSLQRALAVNDLLDLYQGTHEAQVAAEIFKGDPFGSIPVGDDVGVALRRAYEVGHNLYPLSFTEFRIAGWYGTQLRNAPDLSEEQRGSYTEELKKWIELGQMNMPETLRLGYEDAKLGYIYQLEGMALSALAEVTDQDYAKAEASFREGLAVIAPENEIHAYGEGLFLRFHYASILAKADPEGRKDDILDLLDPMLNRPTQFEGKYFFFDDFVKNEADSDHDEHGHKQDLRRLAAISPEFKSYLSTKWGVVLQ